jgi:beta-glucuronidase
MTSRRTSSVARVVAAAGLLLAAASFVRAGTRVELSGDWAFRTDPSRQGERLGWAKQQPEDTEMVDVPHTWNIGTHEDYEGAAWYFRSFSVDEALLGKHAEIYFGATFSRARVWLNGVALGEHEGGYTEYSFDVTARLKPVNYVAVEVDNQPGPATLPGFAMRGRGTDDSGSIWYDWWHYGGIVRDVWLTVSESSLIRRQQVRVKVERGAAEVQDRVFVENTTSRPAALKLKVTAYPPGGATPAAIVEQALSLQPGAGDSAVVLRLDAPKLWHFDHPNLYRLVAELTDERGKLLDSRADDFGVRTIEIRDRHLLLNGERVRLTGVTRHEDSAREGLAETRGTIRSDYADLKGLQVTLTRPVHYPQHPAILEYCDRNGILLIPEIPMWQFSEQQMRDPKVIALAKNMLREMIEQAGSHPSIMAWSVCNESATGTPGGAAYVEEMSEWVKSLDPDRYVSFAADGLGRGDKVAAFDHADFVMMNQYYGSWHGSADALPGALDRVGQLYPDKMVLISEFGLPGVFAADSQAADRLRVDVIREQLEAFGARDWIGGAIFWTYQDYRSHRNLWPGAVGGWVDHGLVDENRQRRPSYDVWRRLNSPLEARVTWRTAEQFPYAPVGFTARMSRRGADEIPSYALRGYTLTWEAHDRERRPIGNGTLTLPEIGPSTEVSGEWATAGANGVAVRIKVFRPTGALAFERELEWRSPVAGGESIGGMKRRGLKIPPPE